MHDYRRARAIACQGNHRAVECDFGFDVVTTQRDIQEEVNDICQASAYRSIPEITAAQVSLEAVPRSARGYELGEGRVTDSVEITAEGLRTIEQLASQQEIAQSEPGNKATNPKDAIGSKKVPIMSVVPWGVIGRIALGLLEGAIKYGRHNYRIYGVRASVYVDATLRHVARFWEGEDLDPDSKVGLHHIDKALASLTVLRDAMLQDNWTDDRPPRSEDGWVDSLNDQAAELIATLGPAKPAYTEKSQ